MTSPAPDDRHAVLFVDDEEKARKYFRMAFARDFPVLTAGNVQEAIELLELHGDGIAILITDQRMPGQQGVELLKRARAEWPQIVRMLTTAYSDLDDAIAAVNRGEILRYITKPWDLEALRAELRHGMEFYLLRRERDLLVEEKLSVLERTSQVDRLRSLLAIGAGLSHLRHLPHALSAWARQAALAQREPASPAEMELWGEEVRQTQELIALHQRLRELDAAATGGFPDLALPAALLADHGFEPIGTGPMLQCRRALLDRLLGVLRTQVADRVGIEESSSGGIRLPGPAVAFLFEGAPGSKGPNTALLDAHVIAWHHGGQLRLEPAEGGGYRIRLVLPADPTSVVLQEPDATWIADQFSLLGP